MGAALLERRSPGYWLFAPEGLHIIARCVAPGAEAEIFEEGVLDQIKPMQ